MSPPEHNLVHALHAAEVQLEEAALAPRVPAAEAGQVPAAARLGHDVARAVLGAPGAVDHGLGRAAVPPGHHLAALRHHARREAAVRGHVRAAAEPGEGGRGAARGGAAQQLVPAGGEAHLGGGEVSLAGLGSPADGN